MFKNFLKRYGPVLMFLLVLGLCVGFVFMSLVDPKNDPDVVQAIKDKQTAENALRDGLVSRDYVASSENIAKIKYVETIKTNINRRDRTLPDESAGVYVSYPQPIRPKSEPPPPPMGKDDLVAKMPLLDESKKDNFHAEAERGKVYVICELPKADGYVLMEPVRFEIFRGMAKDKIDTNGKPWGTIEVGLEAPPVAKAAGSGPTPAIPAEEPQNSRRRPGSNAATGGAKEKPVVVFPLPATKRVFRDTTDITQQTEYFYKVRFVARFTSTEGKEIMANRADGTPYKLTYHAPTDKSLTLVNSATQLYATPFSQVISVKTPTNFQLRLSGINGTVPPIGNIRNPVAPWNKDFSVNFELRAWIPDLNDWKNVQLQKIMEGDTLGGTIPYVKGVEKKEYAFTKDLGFKLAEVNNEEVDSGISGRKTTTEVAQIEDQRTKEKIRFLKAGKFVDPRQEEKFKEYNAIIGAQEREIKRLKDAPPPAPAPAAPAAPAATTPAAPATTPAAK